MQSFGYIHDYCSKFGYLQTFAIFDACLFHAILCKFLHFLYFTLTDAITLIRCKATVTLHICKVTIASLDIYKVL